MLRHQGDERFQHELKEMRETHDLREVDDDVEDVATLLEWHAPEHVHRPKTPRWFMILAVGTTLLAAIFLITFNFIAVITTIIIGGLLYYVAQRKPVIFRYRLMVDGAAINNTLYHYRDLDSFNIIYEPGVTKTVLLRSKHRLATLIHMEIGDADPVAIRDILLEFVREDQDLEEPFADILARRLGF
ncbi:MAG: hypothetical protein U1E51_07405 [Candidatus Binatia bacterium]|nr:hypothetical protein [Candidatus Binatia bacterium]